MSAVESTDLTQAAARHSRRLQLVLAFSGAAWTLVLTLIQPAVDLDFPVDVYPMLHVAPTALLIAIYASWSAIWTAMGGGRWTLRLAEALAIFHVAVLIGGGGSMAIETLMYGFEWRDLLAMNLALSYVFAGQMAVLLACVWPYKLRGYKLLYFDQPADYPHPRRVGSDLPLADRPGSIVFSGRVSLADMFALTTLIAVYLAAWYPLVVVALRDARMFGASFVFMVLLVVLGVSAGIGLLAAFLPLLLAMLDHRGARFQLAWQSGLFAVVCVGAFVTAAIGQYDEEVIVICLAAVLAHLATQLLLLLTLGKPSRALRFRLVRV